MTARLSPPGGLRERANRLLGFVYDVDRKEPEGDTPTNFKSIRQYSDRLDAITDSYQSGKISKTEALAMIAAANDHATTGLALRLFPPQGMREKMAQIGDCRLYEGNCPQTQLWQSILQSRSSTTSNRSKRER